MDQTKNNLDRIRAFDAEEGEWRTINGAHVLIKNGRIAGGAGGALNGQPFRGGSLKKRGGSTSPKQSAAYNTGKKRALEHIKRLTNKGHEDPEALAAVKAEASSYVKKWRDIVKRNPGDETAEKQLGWYETLEKGWGDMLNSGGEPNAIEQKKNAYKAKSDENVIRRDQAAASAKGRLSNLRQLAKSLKARNPNAFKG